MNPIATRLPKTNSFRAFRGDSIKPSAGAGYSLKSGAGWLSGTAGGDLLRTLDSQSRSQLLPASTNNSDTTSSRGEDNLTGTCSTCIDAASKSATAVDSAITTDSAGLEAAKSALQNNLTELAFDPKAFHAALQKSFGSNHDKAKAETIRKQVLEGDFSWMPEIKVFDQSVLQDQSGQQGEGIGFGAYSKDKDTIYISRQLLASSPDKAVQILTEEVGHGLDVRLNTADAAGDEGDIFARMVSGQEISDSELAELKAENDSGAIMVDGKKVEVEYGFFKKLFKKITKPFKAIAKAVVSIVVEPIKAAWEGVKKVGKAILKSKIVGMIMTVAQFIPIPIVQVVARVYNMAKAAYQVYLGVKNGSIGMVLGGVAGLAGGTASVGKIVGASARFVDGAARIANGARTAGLVYQVAAQKNFAAAAALASNYFGGNGTDLGRVLNTAGQVVTTVEKVKRGDVLGAVQSAQAVYQSFDRGNTAGADKPSLVMREESSGDNASRVGFGGFIDNVTGSRAYQAIVDNATTIGDVAKSVKDGDYSTASATFLSNYGEDLGIDEQTQSDINTWAGVVEKVQDTTEMAGGGTDSAATGQAAELLGIPLTGKNQQRLDTVFRLRDSVLGNRYADASRQAAALSLQSGQPELATNFLHLANLLEGKSPVPVRHENSVPAAA